MNEIINKIFKKEELINQPPILLDVGASGGINSMWAPIAKYSICVAFDADDRDLDSVESDRSFHKKFVINKIASNETHLKSIFFLTESPHCSSILKPDLCKLSDWSFHNLFNIVDEKQINSIELASALKTLNVDYIDWIKLDTQGTDLRLFQNIGVERVLRILVAELEPGFMDAYHYEDKISHVLSYMEDKPFWISNLLIKGSKRINKKIYDSFSDQQKEALENNLKSAVGWGEICFINNFNSNEFTKRDYLLMWIFATMLKEYGFALEISIKGFENYTDEIFIQMKEESMKHLFFRKNNLKRNILTKIITKLQRYL